MVHTPKILLFIQLTMEHSRYCVTQLYTRVHILHLLPFFLSSFLLLLLPFPPIYSLAWQVRTNHWGHFTLRSLCLCHQQSIYHYLLYSCSYVYIPYEVIRDTLLSYRAQAITLSFFFPSQQSAWDIDRAPYLLN